jgi:hypothetical protein
MDVAANRCVVCGRVLPVDAFPLLSRPSDQGRDGRSRRCLDCRAAGRTRRRRDDDGGSEIVPERATWPTAQPPASGATRECTRCGRVYAVGDVPRSMTGYPSRLCLGCRRMPRAGGRRRPPLRAMPPPDQPDDGLSPPERARQEMRVFAMALARQQLD